MALWDFLNLKNIQAIGNQPNTNQYAIGDDVSNYIPNQEFVQNVLTEKQVLEPSVNPRTKVGFREKMSNVLSNALLGKQEAPTEHIDLSGIDTNSPEFLENTGGIVDVSISKNPKVGGLLPDIAAGYRENRTTPISLDNFGKNTLEDGRRKGFAYKLGEGLGSFARFADSPVGRGLLMAGIVGATGGGALPAITFGSASGFGNKQNRMKDKLYRDALAERGIETGDIKGLLDDTTFKYLLEDQQLRDNAEYRNAILKGQQYEQEFANQLARENLDFKKMSDVADRALRREELDIAREKIRQNDKKNANLGNLQAVSGQLKRFEDSFASMPNKLESNTLGRLRNATGLQTKEEANFNSQRTLLFNKIARDLGGEKGVLSDQDIKRIEKSLPDYTDSMVQKQAKMQAIYDLLNDRLAVEGGSLDNTQTTTGNTTKSGVKYEVID
jgi:hypothetical protein